MSSESYSNRKRGVVHVYRLREQPGDDISDTTTAEERVAMVWPLTVEAWTLAGRSLTPPGSGRSSVSLLKLKPQRKSHRP